MKHHTLFYVKKETLLAVAGTVWLLAGFNVARLGIIAYRMLPSATAVQMLLSLAVFCAFGTMFYKMAGKHSRRIMNDQRVENAIWNFFDFKSYCIMAVMMGGGIWLRSSGLAPIVLIAVLYTGIGCALAVAGAAFWIIFIKIKRQPSCGKPSCAQAEEGH
ncbi:MAG: hypothetical protein RR135_01135 [Oscillospiraceae bacterium]